MTASAGKSVRKQLSARRLAAQKAEEAAAVLHSFAATLATLDASQPTESNAIPTPRNWWRVRGGRFKDDPTFADFVARVQAARKRES